MKITMISNYINHHQIPFMEELCRRLGGGCRFIQTEPMEEERLAMGWGLSEESLPYLLFLDKDREECLRLIEESELLLIGWTKREELFADRLRSDKLTLRVSERLYREGQWKAVSPRGLLRKWKEHTRYRKKNVYLLCAGAYAASDFSLVGAYPGQKYKFGYFPEFRPFTGEELRKNHPWDKGKLQLVWAGRFIPLKHPEYMIRLAECLKREGRSFHLHAVGGGGMEEELKALTASSHLEEEITFYGFLTPEEVRGIMEKSHIHLLTSNHLEGWGAVVNEAMNSGCVSVANDEAGASRFLIRHRENGLLYHKGSFEGLCKQVSYLFDHPKEGERLGLAAYETIAGEWNAGTAAERLLVFYEQWKMGRIEPPESGPFSVAENIRPV